MLSNIMRDAKRHQRGLVVTLLDLRNTFGDIHHELIRTALRAHHVPSEFLELFDSIYSDFQLSISVNGNWTKTITAEQGVLQGDLSSSLLFNLCFNMLMTTLNTPDFKSLGYTWGGPNKRSWLQFADDASIIASNEKESQTLLNVFQAWCQWAEWIFVWINAVYLVW